MRNDNVPCSMLAIDAAALGERSLSEAERGLLAHDAQRRRRVDEHRERQKEFLRRFPTFESLRAVVAESKRSSDRARSRLRYAILPLSAAAVLVLVILLPWQQRYGNEGIKGAPSMALDMAVVREGVARPFAGQAVREGDTLIFRTRVAIDYLSIFSLEASGRVQAIVVDHDEKRQSLPVRLPPNASCPQSVEVDGYSGRERIVAVASSAPLPAERIAEWLRTSYAAMNPEGHETLILGPPPFAARVTTWLLKKEKP